VIYWTATHACATRATPTVCASSHHRAQPAHEAAQQVVHGAMHEPDSLAVRGEGPQDRAVGSKPTRSFVCRRPRLRVDLTEAAAVQCTAADDGRPRCAASSTSPERGPEYETAFDEPAQNMMERASVVSAREQCSIGAAHADLGGPSFGTRHTRRGRAGELGMSSTHHVAMTESKGASRLELLPVGLTFAALPLAAHGAAARVAFRSRRRSPDRSVSLP